MADIDQILQERGRSYGPFSGHAMATQALKSVIMAHLSDNPAFDVLLNDDQAVILEALDMIAHKIGRIVNGDPTFRDSWDDIAGYAKLVPLNLSKGDTL